MNLPKTRDHFRNWHYVIPTDLYWSFHAFHTNVCWCPFIKLKVRASLLMSPKHFKNLADYNNAEVSMCLDPYFNFQHYLLYYYYHHNYLVRLTVFTPATANSLSIEFDNNKCHHFSEIAKTAGTVEYTECTSAEV